MEKNIPIFNLEITNDLEDDVEVDLISLVDRPAIERSFLAFNENKEIKMEFAIQDEDQQIISGPLMLADTPIYRNDHNGEYYVVFTKETIKMHKQQKMQQKSKKKRIRHRKKRIRLKKIGKRD